MKILIVTPFLPPEMGGPSYYAVGLRDALIAQGHEVTTRVFADFRHMPSGIRHIVFLFSILTDVYRSEGVIALDTWSAALPTVLAGTLLNKQVLIRSGGDFLWERYLERTKEPILLSEFYKKPRVFTPKESLVEWILFHVIFWFATKVVFSTDWQRRITSDHFTIPSEKTAVIENFFGTRIPANAPKRKNYIWAGRPLFVKNLDMLERAFALAKETHPDVELDRVEGVSREALFERVKDCYAVILPSISDVSPNVILEALRFGKPCIVTQETGIVDRLKDIVLFVSPMSVEDIAEKIGMLADPKLYEAYCKKIENFSYVHTYEDIGREFVFLFENSTRPIRNSERTYRI